MYMKFKKLIFTILTLLITTSVIISCKDSEDKGEPGTGGGTGANTLEERTNKWIYEQMQEVYLWNTWITSTPNLQNKNTEEFFNSLLYIDNSNYNKAGDRFSYIEEDFSNSAKAAHSNSLGFDILPYFYYHNDGKHNFKRCFYVVNVREGSDAEKKGLKRGNLIYAVEGNEINTENLIDTYKYLQEVSSTEIQFYNAKGEKESLKINSSQNYDSENPIWINKVIEHNGVRAGYIVYSRFEREKSNDEGSYAYDVELVKAIGDFYKKGITNIIIDLRYNPGGYVQSAVHLASALLPNATEKDIFAIHHFNRNLAKKPREYPPNIYFKKTIHKGKELIANIPESKLERLYILATDNSASASELTIAGLKAYLGDKLIHIGTQTVGKDKASIAYTSDDKDIKWILHPLVSRLTDKAGKGNYIEGLKPDITVDEWREGFNCEEGITTEDDILLVPTIDNWRCDWVELGNPKEALLATALNHIKTGGVMAKSQPEKSSKAIPMSLKRIRPQLEVMIVEPQEIEDDNNQN